jgi:dTDP-4-dehydrorhamnose reductase
MKNILVLGSNGLLGQNLVQRFLGKANLTLVSMEDSSYIPGLPVSYFRIDLTNRGQVKDIINKVKPEIILNAAAYTNVDQCEENREQCWNSNVKAVEHLIECASYLKPILVHFSTDYVFDGNNAPYSEADLPNPRGNYARSKMASENIVRTSELEYLLIRTQVLYGYGHLLRPNFVTWLASELRKGNRVRIVTDQIGNPTYVADLAEAVQRLLDGECYGLYHVSGSEKCSRFEFAQTIAKVFELDGSLIDPITTAELMQKSPRPMNSSFRLEKLLNNVKWLPHDTESALRLFRQELEG